MEVMFNSPEKHDKRYKNAFGLRKNQAMYHGINAVEETPPPFNRCRWGNLEAAYQVAGSYKRGYLVDCQTLRRAF